MSKIITILAIMFLAGLGGLACLTIISAFPEQAGYTCHTTIMNGPYTHGTFPNGTQWRAFGNHVFRLHSVGFLADNFPSYNSRGFYPNGTEWIQVVNCK